ncbi:hypothetical protein [Enterocloster citroniae]|uniref:hypothetical protein n=1 Tax=Enterocloster citroniae TaxID=358743 RepID=UPI0022E049EF|nr:hypothetical protein [Enterocloster citroniae]
MKILNSFKKRMKYGSISKDISNNDLLQEYPYAFAYINSELDGIKINIIPHTLCKTEADAKKALNDEKNNLWSIIDDMQKIKCHYDRMCIVKIIK